MRRVAKVALGCLFAPVGLFVLGLIAFGALRAAGVPDPDVGTERLAQDVPEVPRLQLESTPRAPAMLPVEDVLRVELDLVEGMFRIEPHDGPEIEVEAQYDKATYRLTRSYSVDGDVPVFRLEFASKMHWLRRIAQNGNLDDQDFAANEITVFLPKGLPLDLRVKISRSESELVLDGLSLTNLVTNLSMGEYTFETDTPNPLSMDAALFDVGMGEVTVRGLSHLRARRIDVQGGMGEIRLDFGTSLAVDTVVHTRMRMGEMRLDLPDDALYDADSSFKAILGEVDDRGFSGERVEDPERAKRLRVNGTVLMGTMVVDEFRVRPIDPDDLR